MEELLRMEGISKQFGDFYANQAIDLDVRRGEVHTLLGENGAGKSTLMNVLIGLYQPTEGKIFIRGKAVKIDSPSTAVKLGIGMVHQHFMLVEAMTVFENIILGDKHSKGYLIDKEALQKQILEMAQSYGLDVELDKPVGELSVGAQQRVEILKALYHGAELLVLDEPSAALTDIEVEGLFAIMRKLTGAGKAVVFISHKMREVLHISDRITVLRLGRVVATLDKSGGEFESQQLANLIIGKRLERVAYEKVEPAGDYVACLKNVDYNKSKKHNGLNGVSLTVSRGEIVGIAGVDGNGQTELAQVITGVITPDSGQVDVKNGHITHFSPMDFIKQGVGHIPEDRNSQGLVGDMNISENVVLKRSEESRFSKMRGLLLKKKSIREYAETMRQKYDIRCTSIQQEVRNLSGGNQQKVILARELETEPDLLVAVHPTRGLDIGATRFVHDSIIATRDRGGAVLLISADFDEILEMADRILVMFEGQIIGEYSGKNPPLEKISLAMTGES